MRYKLRNTGADDGIFPVSHDQYCSQPSYNRPKNKRTFIAPSDGLFSTCRGEKIQQ
jgi:hypothetical protein